jgi:hypothetical protein
MTRAADQGTGQGLTRARRATGSATLIPVGTEGPLPRKEFFTMTRSQRTKLVETRADLILAGESATEDYALHFDTQLRRSVVRRILYHAYLYLARSGAALSGSDPHEIV